jgi:hypothetical protein
MKVTVTDWGALYDYSSNIDMVRALYFIDNQNTQKHMAFKKPETKQYTTAQENVIAELKNKYGPAVEIVFDEKKSQNK